MSAHQRRMAIYDRLVNNKTVEVNDLAHDYRVSTMTIRRDLLLFEKQGLVTTTYGGAYLNQGMTTEASFSLKATQMINEKVSIGQFAATLISEHDTIIIDCGSTALQLAKNLPNLKITVITNSWPIVNFLGNNHKIKLILAPGEYNSVSAGTLDSKTIAFFNSLNADKVFLSTQAFDVMRGLSVPDPIDAEVKKSMLNAAKHRILLLDHSKIGQVALSKHAELMDFDQVIVDQDINAHDYDSLVALNPNIIRV
jgi:DeoR family fructose operon transcriptional repressor